MKKLDLTKYGMKYYLIIIQLFISVSCFSQSEKTQVKYFNYGGFGDTIVALLSLDLDFFESENDTNKIHLISWNKESKTSTNTVLFQKKITIGFSYGFYDLEIRRKGFDVVKINNYYAVPDQVSKTKINLKHGQDTISYLTIPPSYLFPKNSSDTIFHDNGKIREIKAFKNDEIINHKKYFEDGSIERQMNYIDKELIYLIQYYQNGKIEFITVYNQGTTIGFRIEYYENGILKEHLINTEAGQKIWERKDSDGNYLIKEGQLLKK